MTSVVDDGVLINVTVVLVVVAVVWCMQELRDHVTVVLVVVVWCMQEFRDHVTVVLVVVVVVWLCGVCRS